MLSKSNQQERWERRYQEGRAAWDRGAPSPALGLGLAQMPEPPARVLIPACGRGYEIAELARRGYRVTGVDFAPSAVADLQKALRAQQLDATVVASDLFTWEPDEPFDVIYEQTALCALEPQQWPEYASRLARWLRPGGLLVGAFMQTHREGGPPWHCPLDAIEQLFRAEQWLWPERKDRTIAHPSGLKELAIILKRRN
ncbi:MAG TPA: thiopurine S-methyltransferase [Gammaproteobacteria bacterium]|nr:thiopurine S-methyltransferase [Acidiferrobacteraceae bacterium]MDP6917740.1 methyltransferase domain-containing protein [Arenicellales bacterium]HCX88600.1 thiopurine S-methyltransferase [Gammaproteobacteria bacterium]|tara:strand:- start:10193 stop:10789 length:597 start_codon:yes stop_codon:yes gene_type:complete